MSNSEAPVADAERSVLEGAARPYETIQLRLVVEADALDEALRFYRDGLGLQEGFDIDGEEGARVVAFTGRACGGP